MKLQFFGALAAKGSVLLLATASLMALSSCGKGSLKKTSVVYLAGTEGVTAGERAVIWEAGEKIYLTEGSVSSSAKFITHDKNGALYVAGWERLGIGKTKAVFWKDGVKTELTDGSSDDAEATSLTIYNGEVYTVGSVGTKAHYWIGKEDHTLTKDGKEEKVLSVSQNGSGVYAVGHRLDGNSATTGDKIYTARYWDITDSQHIKDQDLNLRDSSAQGNSVDTTQKTIAIAGYDQALSRIKLESGEEVNLKPQATYWSANWITNKEGGKDGGWGKFTEHNLTDGKTEAKANAVFIDSSGKIFAGGYIKERSSTGKKAVYWEDGDLVYLTDGKTDAEVKSILVLPGNVYSAGYIKSDRGNKIPCYWINKKLVKLESNGNAEVNSITVRN